MAVFAVISQHQAGTNPEALSAAIAAAFSGNSLPVVAGSVWLVADAATAEELSAKLGITGEGASGAAIIVEVGSYFGRANPNIWTWIKTKWEATSGIQPTIKREATGGGHIG